MCLRRIVQAGTQVQDNTLNDVLFLFLFFEKAFYTKRKRKHIAEHELKGRVRLITKHATCARASSLLVRIVAEFSIQISIFLNISNCSEIFMLNR